MAEALRLNDAGVFVGGKLVKLVFDPHFFFHFGQQYGPAQRRGEGGNQQAVIAAGIGSGEAGRGVPADARS